MSMFSGVSSEGLPSVPFLRRRYRVVCACVGESRTKQSFAVGCDVNSIIKSFFKSGTLSHIVSSPPRFADVSSVGDFKGAQESVLRGMEIFSSLSALDRERFGNDAAAFLEWAADAANALELRAILGDPLKEPTVPSTVAPAGSGAQPQGGKPDKAPKAPKGPSEPPSGALPGLSSEA